MIFYDEGPVHTRPWSRSAGLDLRLPGPRRKVSKQVDQESKDRSRNCLSVTA